MSLNHATLSTLISPAGAPVFMSNLRIDGDARIARAGAAVAIGQIEHALGDVAAVRLVEDQRRRQAARSAGFCTPIQRAVWTEPSWLMNETQALLVWTFCGTPRFGTTITPRSAS